MAKANAMAISPRLARRAALVAVAAAAPLLFVAGSASAGTPPKVGACNIDMHVPIVEDTLHEVYASPAGPAAQTAVGVVCSL